MAPSCMVHMEEERGLAKEKNKLRKPVVEKMRRDRINSSIEQLKVLLEKEFQRHQPNSKLEKADILEVAVSYLKQQQHQIQAPALSQKNPELDFNTGYLRCLKEALHFLSFCEPKRETQARLIKHFCKVHVIADRVQTGTPAMGCLPPSPRAPPKKQTASKKPPAPATVLWRPWRPPLPFAPTHSRPEAKQFPRFRGLIMATAGASLEIQPSKAKIRLQKPLVEKLRRDRINGSIEQLKLLLEKEFQRHQPSSKLEKADVLEMTVSYLRYSQTLATSSGSRTQDYSKGYSSCLKETLQFLAIHSTNSETQSKLLSHFQKPWEVASKDTSPLSTPALLQKGSPQGAVSKPAYKLWRPW
nr:transcription factor HES-4-A-like [Podarcis muralis]